MIENALATEPVLADGQVVELVSGHCVAAIHAFIGKVIWYGLSIDLPADFFG